MTFSGLVSCSCNISFISIARIYIRHIRLQIRHIDSHLFFFLSSRSGTSGTLPGTLPPIPPVGGDQNKHPSTKYEPISTDERRAATKDDGRCLESFEGKKKGEPKSMCKKTQQDTGTSSKKIIISFRIKL